MSSDSLLLLELFGSSPGATSGAFLDDSFCGDQGYPPGVTLTTCAGSGADPRRSCGALSVASSLAPASIENCSFACTLTNRRCSSLAHFR